MTRTAASLFALALLAMAISASSHQSGASHAPISAVPEISAESPDAIQPIYSNDPNDSWNRIFHFLFTRTFQAHISDEFPELSSGPYEPFGDLLDIRVSTRTIARTEIGDAPVDPLYSPPVFMKKGNHQLLDDPAYSDFTAALREALGESAHRSPLARALFQSDLWSAYDIFFVPGFPEDRGTVYEARRKAITDLLAQLVKKLALSSAEIRSLPDNYAAARARDSLPDLFSPNSDWIELQWFPDRQHDTQAEYRRASRIFVKPAYPPQDRQKFLTSLRDKHGESASELSGTIILLQPLLIDSEGRLVPSPLTTSLQLRLFRWRADGSFQSSDVESYELRRRLMLTDPATGGLAVLGQNAPVYLSGGGSYGFAEPAYPPNVGAFENRDPLVVKLRSRCAFCHGPDQTRLMTFQIKIEPGSPLPPVRILDQTAHQTAEYDIAQKSKRREWRALHAYFESTGGAQN